MKDKVKDINEQMNQINEKINQTTHDIEQHHDTFKSLMVFLSSLVRDFIGPATETSRRPQLQKLFDDFKIIQSQFETKYNNRASLDASAPPNLSPSHTPKLDENMNR